MNAIRYLLLAFAVALAAAPALAQSVKIKQGMLNVPALSPLWLLPEEAKKHGIEIEMVMFQRFADARTALASGDIQITAFGPQDISLALGAGAKSLVGVAGVGSGNDCLIVRKGEDIKNWKEVPDKRIGIGAGSISWLKFAASVQENGLQYNKLKIVNIVGGGANYLKALQGKEIDMAVVWHPFCAQAIVDGYGAYPTLDHNRSKTVGGLISVLAVNRPFMEKNRDTVQKLVNSYVSVLEIARKDTARWARSTPRRPACRRTWRRSRSAPRARPDACRSSRSSASRSSCPTTASSRATCRARSRSTTPTISSPRRPASRRSSSGSNSKPPA